MNNKGQVMGDFGNLAVGIAGLAILLTVAFLVLDEGLDAAVEDAPSFSINETVTATVNQFHVVHGQCTRDSDASVLEVYNGTRRNSSCDPDSDCDYVLMNPGNYTVVGNTINFSSAALGSAVTSVGGSGGTTGDVVQINASGNCQKFTFAQNATNELKNATNTIPGWIPLIVIAMIGAALLGLVQMFRRRT